MQALLAMDKGGSSFLYRFPTELEGDHYRVHLYAQHDYSAYLHGNPVLADVTLPTDAWVGVAHHTLCPYGTNHAHRHLGANHREQGAKRIFTLNWYRPCITTCYKC